MEVVLTKMETFCTGSGRASQLGCYVQTISWTNGVRDNENFQIMNGSFWLQDVGVDDRLRSSGFAMIVPDNRYPIHASHSLQHNGNR